ncbi:hypothetical protein [Breznakiella homolactica]|uniref:Lipoprotein n=1 Tax=Breznakiella homolactica TaxID=2798577 RepID=A0A7T7XLB6_9SPIR|nr:hypothetical protein [Breznakiella homolactica]QQO08382.1 hypothetical protein JFL75_15795 [Breznakiella homolactica]
MKYKFFCGVLAVLSWAVISGCVSGPGGSTAEYGGTGAAAERGTGGSPERPGDFDDGLNTAAFRSIPAEAGAYLSLLSRAFSQRDGDFLMAQGEPLFEKQVRPDYDEDEYLAMLYRIGPYAAESPDAPDRLPRLTVRNIRGIRYTAWDEVDFMLEISGRIVFTDGADTPCRIMLLWHLPEPKILGCFP